MRQLLRTTLATAFLTLISANADAQHYDAGHSLEADQHDERAEGVEARSTASLRVRWQDPAGRHDPRIAVKLLGINDFHGQLSPRTLGPPNALRPVGGASVLAAYLKAASEQAEGPAFIIHAGDHVGATPPNSALLQDEPAVDVLNTLANKWCIPFKLQRKLPDFLEPYAQAGCNVVGTLGNHEFDEGASELLRLLTGGNHPNGPFLRKRWEGARFPRALSLCISQRAEHQQRQDTVAALYHQDRWRCADRRDRCSPEGDADHRDSQRRRRPAVRG